MLGWTAGPRRHVRPGRSSHDDSIQVPAEINPEAGRALQIIESMPTIAWSANASGSFTYVSLNALAFLGTAHEDPQSLPRWG